LSQKLAIEVDEIVDEGVIVWEMFPVCWREAMFAVERILAQIGLRHLAGWCFSNRGSPV
jgi:hypothetical protein